MKTTITDTSNNQNHFMQGWKCPRCGRINAPWKSHCDCTEEPKTNWPGLPDGSGISINKLPYYKNNPCKYCSNNPDNGGSGNCNCILGLMNEVTC